MSRIVYDNWERLVVAVVRREKDRQLAYCDSFSTCCPSDLSSRFDLDLDHLQYEINFEGHAPLVPPVPTPAYPPSPPPRNGGFFRRRRLLTVPNTQPVENLLLQQGSFIPKRYTYSDIKKMTKSFSHTLGQGGYGSVYKGMLPNGCLVAVKVMDTDSNREQFINEVASICTTSQHVNIITLLGFCSERSKRALVYEFMPNSSLDKFLNQSAGAMDLQKLYKIAVGIAKGLEYLHTGCTTRIVHFDIKPQNILLDEDFCPKISDIGLAKLCKKKQSIISQVGTIRGTPGYIAPEVFSRNFRDASHKSDVYNGMLLLKMAQEHKVVESEAEAEAEAVQSSEEYFPDKILYDEAIKDAKRCELVIEDEEKETTTKMFVVGFWCIQIYHID